MSETKASIRRRHAAYRWAKKGARENPGVRFVALINGRRVSYEADQAGKVRRVR